MSNATTGSSIMSTPIPRPKSLDTICKGGHDTVREYEAIWISKNQYLYAQYRCMVCGFAWDDPTEKPSMPQSSRFHVSE